MQQSQEYGPDEIAASRQSPLRKSARRRLLCTYTYGCPCCGPGGPQWQNQSDALSRVPVQSCIDFDILEQRSLALRAAAVDGSRDHPYVDAHIHLEMVLQKVRWFESAPSLLAKRWEHLSEEEQRCWGALGFTASKWNKEFQKNPTWFKRWKALSTAEQSAAQSLGWDEEKWDGFHWLLPTKIEWNDLWESTRQNLTVLGETPSSWNNTFVSRKPAGYVMGGDMRKWPLLSEAEQQAAAQLGFSPASWDMEEMSDIHAYIRDFCGSGFEGCITQGCDLESIDDCVKLALAHPLVYAALGCHPKNAWQYYEENMEEVLLSAFEACGDKVIAWGECGLDFSNESWGNNPEYRSTQFEVFERQLKLAIERELPLTLHIRDAADDALRILQKCVPKRWKAHVHGYTGPSYFVDAILDFFPNFYIGLTGTVSMGRDGDGARMARLLPLERMLLETDGPYFIPRGTLLNHVGQIPLIATWVADVKCCSVTDVLTRARANTKHVYGI